MKSAELFVRCLECEGVEYIFGLPGEENIEFLNVISTSKIKFILTHDERGGAFMANAYGRPSGFQKSLAGLSARCDALGSQYKSRGLVYQ